MEYSDKLYPEQIKDQCDSAMKTQINDYLYITSAMVSANEMDMEDLKTLKESVGNEELLGEGILSNKNDAREETELHQEAAASFLRKAEEEQWYSVMRLWYTDQALYYVGRAHFAQKRYEKWKEKEDKFDRIDFHTKNLFTRSATFRDAAKRGLESVTQAFQNGIYVIDASASWRADICMENAKKVEEAKQQFMMQNEDGEWV